MGHLAMFCHLSECPSAIYRRLLTIVPISTAIDKFAEEKVRLQLEGTPAHNNFDLLIGCTAVANQMVMVTANVKDFKNIQGIQIENWER